MKRDVNQISWSYVLAKMFFKPKIKITEKIERPFRFFAYICAYQYNEILLAQW